MRELPKYKILTFIRFIGDAFFWAFFSRFLVKEGYTNDYVGLLISFSPLFSIILNPIYARFTKNINNSKTVLGIITIVEAISIFLIGFNFGKTFVLILTIINAMFSCCHYSLMDSLVTVYAKSYKVKYTQVRIYGSIAYVCGTIIGGFIANESYFICFTISAVLLLITAILYLSLKKVEYTEQEEVEKISYKELFSNKLFVLFLIFYALMHAVFYSCDSFYSVFLASKGVSDLTWGFVYAYYVVFEVITLALLNKFKPYINRMKTLIFAYSLFLVRLIVFYLDLPVWLLIGISALRGISYAIILYSFVPFVVYLVGRKKGPFGVMIISFFYSICNFGMSNIDGWLIELGGFKLLYLVNIILTVLFILLGFVLYRLYRKIKDHKEVEDESTTD